MALWRELKSIEDWQEVLDKSSETSVMIFKHSTTCPISARAWNEFQSYLADTPHPETEYVMVKVIESRPVSNRIAQDLQVRHESPQAILLQHRKAVWNASHGAITQSSLRTALRGELL